MSHAAAVNLAFARRACHDQRWASAIIKNWPRLPWATDVSIGRLLPLLSGATVVVAGELKTLGASGFWQRGRPA